jgi:hypothetical protein
MTPPLTIIEVLGRSEQGMTRPFLCRADDGRLYYVKGRYAGWRSLCCEWVAGNLARAMGLRVPDFAIAEVPRLLVEGSDRPDIRDLGAGPVFASALREKAREITWAEAQGWSAEVRARVLVCDRWVQNEDRSLSALGGNPNLLITVEEAVADTAGRTPKRALYRPCLWAFDFNLAFDPDFDTQRFLGGHIFESSPVSAELRSEMERRMAAALAELPRLFERMPVEWLYLDGDESLPVHLDQKEVYNTLNRPFADPEAFWLTQ